MLILVAVGVMNIPAMAVLTVVIFAEKILPQGLLIARLTGRYLLRRGDCRPHLAECVSRSERVLSGLSTFNPEKTSSPALTKATSNAGYLSSMHN